LPERFVGATLTHKDSPPMDHPAELLGLTRRATLPAFAVFALLGEAAAQDGPRLPAERWIAAQDEIARAFAGGQMTPLAWMGEVERLAREVDLAELMATVGRARLTPAPGGASNDPAKRVVRFLDSSGRPRRLTYGAALFAFEPHNVVTPHGHRNMASAHLIVDGAFRVRNFDRVGDEDDAMVLRPPRDFVGRLGDVSTMTSARDNIHWFVPDGGPAMTFDVILSGLDDALPNYEIRAVDPLNGRRRANGDIVAPIIGFEEASRRYTADL
jgi:hypothetical protein